MSGQGNRPAGNQTAPPMNDGASANTGGVASYTLPGVLHYLQVEWRKFEKERNQWEIEKSDLKVRMHKGNCAHIYPLGFCRHSSVPTCRIAVM